ncbi:regulating synaptic membrane exocytosis protein 3 isoform X1 [Callithrix jacchus]|uniref:Regulating synaptic membrane exocytosis 3 n=1 Tax=Callithrix jacchus TaxID=9483 RepID=A0A8I3WT09_CALJA|nr:regulating synaptic membrane exocytosis protein 3 isoform X1 [Callithrix jacchus]XP_054115184.1 regulating synaptic membrane exocytosis protein 3 isoform X1 [Callithrix jacchus]
MFNGEPGPASSGASRNVVRSSSISGEICGSQQAGGGTGTTTAKKRRSSLGAKMVAIVGLTQWSKSTLQLPQPEGATKKLRSNIRRSTETGIAVEMRSRVTRQGSRESTDGSTNSNSSDGTFIFPTTRLGAESQFSDFLDGLGPAQIVGRQTLATPPMGDVHIAIMDRSGQLEVEVIEARGLTPKPGSKSLPGDRLGRLWPHGPQMLHGHGPDHAGRAGPERRGHRLVQTLPHLLSGRLHTRIPHQAPVPVLPGECHQPLMLLRMSGREARMVVWGGVPAGPTSPLYIVFVSFWTPCPAACLLATGLIPAGSGDCSVCVRVCVCT